MFEPRAGELPMEIALETIEYLGAEMDYVPWEAAQKELSYVRKMLVRTSLYGKYKVRHVSGCWKYKIQGTSCSYLRKIQTQGKNSHFKAEDYS